MYKMPCHNNDNCYYYYFFDLRKKVIRVTLKSTQSNYFHCAAHTMEQSKNNIFSYFLLNSQCIIKAYF